MLAVIIQPASVLLIYFLNVLHTPILCATYLMPHLMSQVVDPEGFKGPIRLKLADTTAASGAMMINKLLGKQKPAAHPAPAAPLEAAAMPSTADTPAAQKPPDDD